jgi:hypothetical protein
MRLARIATSTASPAESRKLRGVSCQRAPTHHCRRGPFCLDVNHLANGDGFGGGLPPVGGRDEREIVRRQQVLLRFIRGFDRHVEEPRKLFVRRGPAPFDNRRRYADRTHMRASQCSLPTARSLPPSAGLAIDVGISASRIGLSGELTAQSSKLPADGFRLD